MMTKIKVGDLLPTFSLPDENNMLVDIKEELKQNHLIIYFYPKDNTMGCTVEASKFRDSYSEFLDKGARVIGISADPPESHRQFKEKCAIPYTLLSDTSKEVRDMFGIKPSLFGLLAGRVTYVVDKTGEIKHVFDSQWQPEKHIEEALEALETI
ncbi:MAG: peroxiredoxin [Cyclobacteriaceae bacterium]